ncbi:ribosomal protection-like ABC-F family protein [Gudongella sp. SC589]|jgi:macrolide transport system ATP-binding/permease protein|uniref:ribosomal protection-like ABC-F family protein n=1 Tax=Gudongella sp. SC589 TaxID=3385990 RepID=UPI003904904F
MLLIECKDIKKYYGDRLILEIDDLKIYEGDRVGIVGVNGSGKTTLLNIISKMIDPEQGFVRIHGSSSYISQIESPDKNRLSEEMASRFGVGSQWKESMSGGEKTRFKVAAALEENTLMLFADEPTSNADLESIMLMEDCFGSRKGTLVLISHDRRFLDKLCNKIIEIEDGKLRSYKGNYTAYRDQKAQEIQRAKFEYQEYVDEKKRLQSAIGEVKGKSSSIRQAPKRMGNSEARLHKMGGQRAKASLDSAAKNIQKRIEHMEKKEKPREPVRVKFDIPDSSKTHSKILIEGKGLNKSFGSKRIFDDAEFMVDNGAKIALLGPNGCGKSTLIKMIMDREEGINVAKSAKIGYFSQDLSILKEERSIIENVMENSIYPETFARILLARLLFRKDSVHKTIKVLSGGERVKVSFAKILMADFNMLILDEPTNYLDITSLEVVEEALEEYNRTLLFVSHDREFIGNVADQIMTIENGKIKLYKESYEEYREGKDKSVDHGQEQIMVLKNRLSEIISRISMPSKEDDLVALELEYKDILGKLNRVK